MSKIKVKCSKLCCLKWMRTNVILLATLAAIIVGALLGMLLRPLRHNYDVTEWVSIWGELFLRLLKLIMLPLTMACIIVGLTSLESNASGRLGAVSMAYIFLTQVIGAILGIIIAYTIRPGNNLEATPPASNTDNSYTDVFTDLLRNLFPDNIVGACIRSVYTKSTKVPVEGSLHNQDIFNNSLDTNVYNHSVYNGSMYIMSIYNISNEELEVQHTLIVRDAMNTMGIVMISIFLGLGIQAAGEEGRPLLKFFHSLNAVVFKLMKVIIWYSPVGILSLIASALLRVDDVVGALHSLGMLVVAVLVCSIIHKFVILPLLYLAITRKNPFPYYKIIINGILAGGAVPSSAAAMPYFLEDCVEKGKLNGGVIKFFLPLAVSMNRDGSASFICLVSIFVAQTYGIQLAAGKVLVLCLLVCILSAATPAVPSSSIFIVILVSAAIDIPVSDRLGLIMAVEWITDRMRTLVNVTSTGYGCAIVDHICSKRLHLALEVQNGEKHKDRESPTEMDSLLNGHNNVVTKDGLDV